MRPARNRVTPLGEIVAAPGRGAWMGNRGRSRAWITCVLSFKDRRLPQWEPGHYTQLFFLDEAVALAAGHRPCAECRRAHYNAYRSAWAGAGPPPLAKDLDLQLHSQRIEPATRLLRLHRAGWDELPAGTFVLLDQGPAAVLEDHLAPWLPDNRYGEHLERPTRGRATVVTPPGSLEVLRAGYPVQIDRAAR